MDLPDQVRQQRDPRRSLYLHPDHVGDKSQMTIGSPDNSYAFLAGLPAADAGHDFGAAFPGFPGAARDPTRLASARPPSPFQGEGFGRSGVMGSASNKRTR